jgi:ubiquinone/menaquinone biosynthesis C-methylase UbiE
MYSNPHAGYRQAALFPLGVEFSNLQAHRQGASDGVAGILLDFLSQGIDIDGLDISPEMLAICSQKAERLGFAPRLYQQEMEQLDLPRQYRTILIPSSSLQLVTDESKVRQAMQRFFRHLLPGGALVTPFSFDWQAGEPIDRGWELLFEKTRPEDGAVVRSWTHEWVETDAQLWHSEQRFDVEVDGRVVYTEEHPRSPAGRWYTQAQAQELFHQAGFDSIQIFHEFTRDLASPADRLFSVLGVKPASPSV